MTLIMQGTSLAAQNNSGPHQKRPVPTREVAVIGAGPYGLSVAAHLQGAGAEPYVIGQPLSFWKNHMPTGMILRSKQEASNIAAPQQHLTLRAYQREIGRRLEDPLPIADFIAYGDWFQRHVAPSLDPRQVQRVSHNGQSFELAMDDGERIYAKSVVLSLGIGLFLSRPAIFADLPRELAPHSSDLSDLSQFRGQRVGVIGRGQSALEYAAILHENGAEVEIITRGESIRYRPLAWRKNLFRTLTSGPLLPFSYRVFPPTDLGDIKTARKMADPDKFRRQTPEVQEKLLNDCRKPVGAYWLQPRLEGVRARTGVMAAGAEVDGDGLRLTLSDGSRTRFDRVVLATGYRIDTNKYQILDNSLRQEITQTESGYPILSTGLETSVKGLYMAGVIGEKTLGPTLRFVTGTSNAGPRVAAAITQKRAARQIELSNHTNTLRYEN